MVRLTDRPRVDDFRALSRSSPWRFNTLHFRHRSTDFGDEVEAWLDRPSQRVTVRSSEGVEVSHGVPYGTSGNARDFLDRDEPEFRPDGLVIERPRMWHLAHGDPMWRNYIWTAMLDPEELSHGVHIHDVRTESRLGRRTWSATCRPLMGVGEDWEGGYDPRCGCCPLLDSEASRLLEYGPDRTGSSNDALPTSYRVHLDVQTAITVEIAALDGNPSTILRNEILDVDTPLTPPQAN